MSSASIENLNALVEDKSRKSIKAWSDAIRGEGHQLMAVMRSQIRAGTPAPGHAFAPRSMISRLLTRARLSVKSAVPLNRLANAVTYNVSGFYSRDQNFQVEVGFTKKRSAFWAREAAYYQQKGFVRPVTRRLRRYFAEMGGRRAGSRSRRQKSLSRWLFLSKNTTTLKTPARPIVAPFWDWQRSMAIARIRKNYAIKMAGGYFDRLPGSERYAAKEYQEYVYIPALIGPVKLDIPIGRGGRSKTMRS